MGMIQGVDGNALINAMRQGREDRFNEQTKSLALQKGKMELDNNRQFNSLAQQYTGASGGVSGYASPNPQANVPSAVDRAFNPTDIAAGANPADVAPPMPQAPPPAQHQGADPALLQRMIFLNPQKASEIMTSLKSLSETQLKQEDTKNIARASAAAYLERFPPEQRAAMIEHVLPGLLGAGIPMEQIQQAAGDLSDNALRGWQAFGQDYHVMIENDLKEREFQAGKTVPVTAGGNVALVKPDGTARFLVGGQQGGQSAAPVPVHSAEEYAKLPPGTPYVDAQGNHGIKQGGPASQAPGTF